MLEDRYSRQSFLGENSQSIISSCTAGVVGLGGGGSHIVQQLAHIGFLNYVLFDGDITEKSNLNRNIGVKVIDATNKTSKIDIAKIMIMGLQPKAKINACKSRWQNKPELLKKCDFIIGCVDGFSERNEIEVFSRRYLMPYIDIGLDIHHIEPEAPVMGGQVILSMPGELCFRCLGFLTEEKLAKEAAKYGDAGINPQVVWANGVLASTAVGIAVDLLTDWTKSLRDGLYMSYNGNKGIVNPHIRLKYVDFNKSCPHFPPSQVGDPVLKTL